MKTVTMQDDVWHALQRKAEDDVMLRVLLKLMEEPVVSTMAAKPSETNRSSTTSTLQGSPLQSNQAVPSSIDPRQSGQQLGRKERHRYASEREMKPQGGIVYERKGVSVVLPFATERNPDRWFLGAPVTAFNNGKKPFLILLCWKDGKVLDFVIPPDQVSDLTRRLTLNPGGQYMFNVARRNSAHYELLVPGYPKDITGYLHADKLLLA